MTEQVNMLPACGCHLRPPPPCPLILLCETRTRPTSGVPRALARQCREAPGPVSGTVPFSVTTEDSVNVEFYLWVPNANPLKSFHIS